MSPRRDNVNCIQPSKNILTEIPADRCPIFGDDLNIHTSLQTQLSSLAYDSDPVLAPTRCRSGDDIVKTGSLGPWLYHNSSMDVLVSVESLNISALTDTRESFAYDFSGLPGSDRIASFPVLNHSGRLGAVNHHLKRIGHVIHARKNYRLFII
jgi:hypothetical protein